jgi:EAL domain-containing protein (putative c-di-GMP-specific phosphodiesterase class I)
MAVNLSPVQFRTTGFADKVVDIVRTSGADPRRIELEVTESVLLDDDEPVRTALKTLRSAGLRIALDDFGTGYSSLSYLKRFEVDKIKIDKSFIQHLGQTADSAAIVTAVVTLGHAMGLAVTAEGVETEEQKQFLAAAGCTTMQGYLFSRALPEKQLASVLPDHGRNILVA